MTRKKPPADKKTRDGVLSGEEQALWSYVAKSVTPISAKGHVRKRGATRADEDEVVPPSPRMPARSKPIPMLVTSARLSQPSKKPTPALADFDQRAARKISKGRIGIDARLDLHGLRHDDARHRLRAFLRDSAARGHRTVLVITGKGRAEDDPSRSYADTLERSPRGVLRRSLPGWLADPEMRIFVVSYTQATQQHGGDGAFYVQLRRLREG